MNPKSNDTVITTVDLSRTISILAAELGADLYGVADASGFLDPAYKGNRPQEIMPMVRAVVLLGVIIPSGCLATLPKGRAEYTNTLMAGTATLRIMAFRIAREIERAGYLATLVPTEGSEFGYWYADRTTLRADVSLKYAGYLAGLGSFGLNHLLITRAGPRIRITAVLTDAPLEPGEPAGDFLYGGCRECLRCIDACPVSAIRPDGSIERERCADYMFSKLGGLRCGMCVRVCPAGDRVVR